ncbi:MAG: hypothetical protein COT91_03910 [Candidatus Doudnabacteria bacterium CG10_big_fil_rev_8_21_14_0_10_41_10]|uniref:Pentapeptide repeat-containing protein n=1 Tax=Candidatus Doudnabacteria bacterium CG10_big_fil_rev_8_21_14_0_10_41_10 TaxID=1974551 RepID=A0A2H0VCW4_9BACT|nr:MAG: hypothetical protein COT91_03910 [Candidatus Doudnabacteria bacterium CG10_big_fil_rev_8_21_14_0_10_41_10]
MKVEIRGGILKKQNQYARRRNRRRQPPFGGQTLTGEELFRKLQLCRPNEPRAQAIVREFNRYRKDHLFQKISFADKSFAGLKLEGIDLSGIDLTGANFSLAKLNRARFRSKRFGPATVASVNFSRAKLAGSLREGVLFADCNLSDVDSKAPKPLGKEPLPARIHTGSGA